jgi:aspartyl-tRNA(Asn)/glutamyl-tRNA(Gln) amidotransferase subunit A
VTSELHFLTIAQLSELIAAKQLSPVELTERFLARIDLLDDRLHSFITVTAEGALRQAKEAEAEIMAGRSRGRMHGIPFALKDIYNTAGIRTTASSRLLINNVPTYNATVTSRLYDAGAILLGKNTTWEFTHGQPSRNDPFPPTRNPWNTANHTEGSSTGSAAAVAAGLVPATMGSDTGGSIREPAAACGVVGLKPTYGRVSRYGVLPNSFSHDHCGPITWTVEDCAIVMSVIAGFDPLCTSSADVPVPNYLSALTGSIAGHRVGIVRDWFEIEAPATDEMLVAFEESLMILRELGASIRDVILPPLQDYQDAKKTIAMAELFSIHATDLRTRAHLFGDSLRYLILCGGLLRAEDYVQATRWRQELASAMRVVFREVDLLVLPTMSSPAGKLEEIPHESFLTDTRAYTTPFNVSGCPALSLCNGFSTSGMPLSLQIAGRPFEEATVMRAGDAYEKATPWRKCRPNLVEEVGA